MSKLPDDIYWRYKKDIPPEDEFPGMNGEVKIIKSKESLPPPFKCSKCSYIAKDAADSKLHWLDHD